MLVSPDQARNRSRSPAAHRRSRWPGPPSAGDDADGSAWGIQMGRPGLSSSSLLRSGLLWRFDSCLFAGWAKALCSSGVPEVPGRSR